MISFQSKRCLFLCLSDAALHRCVTPPAIPVHSRHADERTHLWNFQVDNTPVTNPVVSTSSNRVSWTPETKCPASCADQIPTGTVALAAALGPGPGSNLIP